MDRAADKGSVWLRLAAMALAAAAVGLPVSDLFGYALLLAAAVAVFAGRMTRSPRAWIAAVAVAALAVLIQALLAVPRIEEGHNVFLGGAQGRALQEGLPAPVHERMLRDFDARYPAGRRCDPAAAGCWRSGAGPARAYAFSADGLPGRPVFSRRVDGIGFSDPVWLRIGAFNERQYNWYVGASDVQRVERERGLRALLHPWRVVMPFFVMYRLPADRAGGRLCWRGDLMWEHDGGRFETLRHETMNCRVIAATDTGRMIFGLSVAADARLAMRLDPPAPVRVRQLAADAAAGAGVAALLLILVNWRRRRLALAACFASLSVAIVFLTDSSLIGGVRPFDGGDDGLFYEGVGRIIAGHLIAGEWRAALEGGEAVFYYGGPGLRYFRALERFLFGESFLGYLSLLLAMPFVVAALLRRFLPVRIALALTLAFVALPLGGLFGTAFFQYAKWTARGFADPAAYILFAAGLLVLAGRSSAGPGPRLAPALAAGLLFALALFMRPIVAPAAAVLLLGAGLAALWQRQWVRFAGLCVGFLPTFGMALHNWVFGGVFVLFSANAGHPWVYVTPFPVYLAALGEIVTLNLAGGNVVRVLRQLADWLAGPSEHYAMVPLHALAVAVLVRVMLRRGYDPWLRLIAAASLAQHLVGMTHVPIARYYYLAWLLTGLVNAVWIREEAAPWLRRRHPELAARVAGHPVVVWMRSALSAAARGGRTARPASARRGEAAG